MRERGWKASSPLGIEPTLMLTNAILRRMLIVASVTMNGWIFSPTTSRPLSSPHASPIPSGTAKAIGSTFHAGASSGNRQQHRHASERRQAEDRADGNVDPARDDHARNAQRA